MGTNDRQRLVSMVRGGSDRSEVYRIRFGDDDSPRTPLFVEESELEKFADYKPGTGQGVEYFLMFGCPRAEAEQVLRERPCLVRQGGRFVAVNPEKQGPVYLIEE